MASIPSSAAGPPIALPHFRGTSSIPGTAEFEVSNSAPILSSSGPFSGAMGPQATLGPNATASVMRANPSIHVNGLPSASPSNVVANASLLPSSLPSSAAGHQSLSPGSASCLSSSRLFELLDALKSEVDRLVGELNIRKSIQDDLDIKLQAQLAEMSTVQQYIQDLERNNLRMHASSDVESNRRSKQEPSFPASSPSNEFISNLALKGLPNFKSRLLCRMGESNALSKLPISRIPRDPPRVEPNPSLIVKSFNDDMYNINYQDPGSMNIDIDLLHVLDHSSVVCSIAFSHDGSLMATGSSKFIKIFESITGKIVSKLEYATTVEGEDLFIRSLAFSPDSMCLASGAEDKLIRVWILETSKVLCHCEGHTQDIYSISYSPCGKFIVSGSGDSSVKLWDASSGQLVRAFDSSTDPEMDSSITSVRFSPCGRFIAAGSLDKSIRIWKMDASKLLHIVPEAHADSVYSVAFSQDGSLLLSAGLDRVINVWNFDTVDSNDNHSGKAESPICALKKISTLMGHKDFVLAASFLGETGFIVSGSKDKQLILWKLEDPKRSPSANVWPYCWFQAHKNSIISLVVAPNGTECLIASGSGDKKAKVWRYSISERCRQYDLPSKKKLKRAEN